MEFIGHFRRLTPVQRNTFIACFLGWSLDAFDFFILTFCVSAIATQFQAKVSAVAEAIFCTLAMRPVGAFLFGMMADRFGRRLTLMVDIIAYSVFELASAFAPSLKSPPHHAGVVRNRDGRRVGRGRGVGFRNAAGGGTRILLRIVAGRLRGGLSDGGIGLTGRCFASSAGAECL